MKSVVYVTVIVTLLQLAGGCSSMRTIERADPHEASAMLSVGDTVRVVTTDGGKQKFMIAAIEPDILTGTRGERVTIADIHMVSVERFDAGKSVVAGFGTVVIAVTAIAVGLLVSY